MTAADKIQAARELIKRLTGAPSMLSTVAALTDLADAQAQENAKLRQRIEQLEGAVMTALVGRAVSETKPCATPSPENAQ